MNMRLARLKDCQKQKRPQAHHPHPLPQESFRATVSGRKKKTHKHKQICGIVPGLGGYQKFVYVFFFFFFRVIPYGGEKTHKQNSPQNSGTIPWKFCLRVFFFMCFFFFFVLIQLQHKQLHPLNNVFGIYLIYITLNITLKMFREFIS